MSSRENNCVFITNNFEARWGREEEYQLRIKEVTLLENAGQQQANSITLKLPVENLTGELIERLEGLCKTHKGTQQLRMVLLDYTNRTNLSFPSKSKKVKVDNDCVPAVKELGVEGVVG